MAVDPFPGPKTAHQQWFEASVRHQIGLLRVSGSIRNKVQALLDATEDDIRGKIARRLEHYGASGGPADVARLRALAADLQTVRETAWTTIAGVWRAELIALAVAEPEFTAALFRTVVPVTVEMVLPSPAELRAIITSRPFEGRLLKEWAGGIARADVARIQSQVQIGLVQGEGIPEITRRVVGTARLNGVDGVTEITRRDAETITRTAVNHVANQARQDLWRANRSLVSKELYIATLDTATTPVCRSNDGQVFPVGEGPIPPLHMRCRSLRQALLDEQALGLRPMKPVTERGLLREFAADRGFKAPTKRADLPHGTRGDFDDFARRRTRELIGRVPAKTTYQEFLKAQPKLFQDDVLGPTRGKLFREGLTVQKFVNRRGDELTLKQLARKHGDVFRAAGLDPDAYLK